ncbi:hypothetical protein SDC9_71955 [bioreactor metagenome]|uniref:Teneurin-like YD-shell domain-containing protein n=1 Tax=bioreactor metagenome TaxID=1076179 RepID=A0A644YC32_9ZZZZ
MTATDGCTADITTDPKGNVSTKIYDRVGRLYQIISDGDTTTYSYNPNGTKAGIAYPNGLTTVYTYYENNKLHTLANRDGGTILEAFSYAYDGNGNMLSKLDGKGAAVFSYDAINRLTAITEPNGTVTEYTYDASGNRIGETVTANGKTAGTDYTYNMQNRLTGTRETLDTGEMRLADYFYDNNGNTISANEQTLTSSASGQSASLVVFSAGSFPGGSAVYEYDGFDRLTEVFQDVYTLRMAYNGEGLRVSKEVTVDNQLGEVQYLYENSNVVLELNGSGDQTAYSVYGGDTLLSRAAGGETLYYLYNGHGDVTALTDEDGDVVASYYYDVFGNMVEETGTADNSVRYAGYRYDKETGLYYLNARFYNPDTARFLSEDTYYGYAADPLSLNLYVYCANNPIIYIDPTGHALTQWDVEHLTSSQIATVVAATNAWNAANAAGDTAGMQAAQAAAAEARSSHLSDNETQLSNGIVVTNGSTSSQTTYAWVGDDQGVVQVTVPASITTDNTGSTATDHSTTGSTSSPATATPAAATTSSPANTTSTTIKSTPAATSSSSSSGRSTAAYTNTATTSIATTKATNQVNNTAVDIYANVVINYSTTALQTIATVVASNISSTAGSVVNYVAPVAVVGAIAGVMVDCQKYDGKAAATAAAITVASTIVTVGVGAVATFFGAPIILAAAIGLGMGTVASLVSNSLKTKYCG